ncbi:MAG: hypothetical protein JWQ07_3257 [Ramlibacter sp.]|nr:hypothetical protein [Ramlibacter sp.]
MRYSKEMPRNPVKSEAVRSIGYDDGQWVLQVKFNNGRIYNYFRVPPSEHQAVMNAKSIGDYVNRQIKRYYEYEELQTEDSAN